MKKNKDNSLVDIYRRVLKYPPVATKRKDGPMKIQHNVNGGSVIIEAPEYVTSEDLEKLYAAMYVCRDKGRVVQSDTTKSVRLTMHVSTIRIVTNCNDDSYIHESLKRMAKLTITYTRDKKYIVMHLVNRAEFDPATGILDLYIDQDFYNRCIEEPLSISIDTYCSLSPTAKNLYSFLASNSANVFLEDTLIERAVIQTPYHYKAQAILKKTLDELVVKHIIKAWKRYKKNGKWHIEIDRYSPQLV